VHSVAFSPDGKLLASAGASNDVQLWNVATHEELEPFKGHTRWVRFCAFSPDGKMLVSVGLDNVVRFWHVADHKEIASLTGHQRRIHFVTFSHAGARVATAGMDRNVKLWNVPKEPSAHVSEQSPKEEPREGAGQGEGVRSACQTEIAKLCPGVEHAGRCLRKHPEELSVACRSAMGRGH
jgi:WD40 repeat protein